MRRSTREYTEAHLDELLTEAFAENVQEYAAGIGVRFTIQEARLISALNEVTQGTGLLARHYTLKTTTGGNHYIYVRRGYSKRWSIVGSVSNPLANSDAPSVAAEKGDGSWKTELSKNKGTVLNAAVHVVIMIVVAVVVFTIFGAFTLAGSALRSTEADVSTACASQGIEVVKGSMRLSRYGSTPISIALDGGNPVDARLVISDDGTFNLTTASGEVYRCSPV